MVSLRAERERQGLSLDDVAARARIPIRYVAALERGDGDVLPPGPFQRGYQRQYLEFLGFDPETEVIVPPEDPLEDSDEDTHETLTITAALEEVPLWRLAFAGFVLTIMVVLSLRVVATLLDPEAPSPTHAAAAPLTDPLAALGEGDPIGSAAGIQGTLTTTDGPLPPGDRAAFPTARLRIRAIEDTRLRTSVDGVESFHGRLPAREIIDIYGNEKIEVWAENLSHVLIHYNGERVEPLGNISNGRKLVFVLN